MTNFHFKSGIVDTFFLAGSTLLLIFMMLSGSSMNPSTPLDHFYWVQGSTLDIRGAPSVSRWTYWGVCAMVDGLTKDCSNLGPAIPISPIHNFNTTTNVPEFFVNNSDTFYYLSRVAWGTLLASTVFSAVNLIISIFSICSYHIQKVNALFSFVGAIFTLTTAALYTACIALAKKHLTDGKIGSIMMGFLWASAVCNLIVLFTSFGACVRESYVRAKSKYQSEMDLENSNYITQTNPPRTQVVDDPYLANPIPGAEVPETVVPQPIDPVVSSSNAAVASTTTPVVKSEHTRSGGITFFNVRRNKKDDESEI